MLDLINCSTKFVNSIDKVSKSIEKLKKVSPQNVSYINMQKSTE